MQFAAPKELREPLGLECGAPVDAEIGIDSGDEADFDVVQSAIIARWRVASIGMPVDSILATAFM